MDGKMVLVIVDAHSKYIDAHVVNAAISSATITKLSQVCLVFWSVATLHASKAVSLKSCVD